MARLNGTLERVTYHDPESGFAVLRVRVESETELQTIVGRIPSVTVGETLEAEGDWSVDPTHGPQFKASEIRSEAPTTLDGIRRYLGSGVIRGVGPKLAGRIVELFGDETLRVFDEYPEMLTSVSGIGRQTLARIKESWKQQAAVRRIMLFLHSHGIGSARAVRIYRRFGDEAVEVLRANPYCLAEEVHGIGFQLADELAGRLGVSGEHPERLAAGTLFALRQLSRKGHTGMPAESVGQFAAELLKVDLLPVEESIAHLVEVGRVTRESVSGEPWLFLPPLREAEEAIAESIIRLSTEDRSHAHIRLDDLDSRLAGVERRLGVELAPEQREAIRLVVGGGLLVVTGGPGVGKTTLLRVLIELFEQTGRDCVLAAPTGRAAKRLSEATERPAGTLHRLLEFDPIRGGFQKASSDPLEGDVFVIDEASMLDAPLAAALLTAVPDGATVVLVGDVDQLPSVGPGAVLSDILASGRVPSVRLTHIFRQAAQSRIVEAAHAILGGVRPDVDSDPDDESDFYFVRASEPEAVREMIVRLVAERIPGRFGLDALSDVQVLTPMNRGPLGRHVLNETLQSRLNPDARGEVTRFGERFRVGDRIIQMVNNYDRRVFNGDLGRVADIDENEGELRVAFGSTVVTYDFDSLDELSLAYALSVHKSQGSEYPAVVMPVHTQHFVMLRRNLLYTGLTRGKQLVVLVGTENALDIAIGRVEDDQRRTSLLPRLCERLGRWEPD